MKLHFSRSGKEHGLGMSENRAVRGNTEPKITDEIKEGKRKIYVK
jgi:hypothetical protein